MQDAELKSDVLRQIRRLVDKAMLSRLQPKPSAEVETPAEMEIGDELIQEDTTSLMPNQDETSMDPEDLALLLSQNEDEDEEY